MQIPSAVAHPPPSPAHSASAAQAFRRYFTELREAFLEREVLFTQVELALLCREHVLMIGPPGTAKSAIASAVLSGIVDEKTGQPSLFAKQLTESTVQTDLIGPVDFKVLTETGRTEYLTDDGMLGATFAFLDEVFDGRDMLLRSILNVLHERELKHGKRLTQGRIECALMTSNRYLSEVLARSPELLLAFADRLSFICFVPKAFARRSSRAAMLQRSTREQVPELRAQLTLQQLSVLQRQVEAVRVPSQVMEGLELLADELERALQSQVAKLPDYVPTKYFSQRSIVKALWALKAAVVRDRIFRRPDRALDADERDLENLRHFFLLGGPGPEETAALLKTAVDPRERAQLDIIRLEHRTFDEALAKARQELVGGVEREAATLRSTEESSAAEAMARTFQPQVAISTAKALREKLVPGPRHPQNRAPLLAAARTLVAATEARLTKGMNGQGEGRAGVTVLAACTEVMELCRATPELADKVLPLCARASEFCVQSLEMILASAEGTEFEDALRLDGLVGLANGVQEELGQIRDLLDNVGSLAPELVAAAREREGQIRERVAEALRRR
ncbi:MAG TPA: AAA family ATPase, partial [Myxococcaceae bacterium]|nr:AAA family ATPase [Myxococcaceae bacterium]